jgi:aminopeptidase YwaD
LSKFFPKNKALIFLENEIVKNKQPMSFVLPNVSASLNVELIDVVSQTFNLNAFVEGSDPVLKNEYIVIGAHYDHIGYGGPTSMHTASGKPQIHNGADDNASGVAVMIEMARKIAESPLKRSVIFSSFSSEELGLLGSAYFTKHPPVSLDKIVTMINLDMVGRMKDNELTAFGASSGDLFANIIDSLDVIDTLSIKKVNDAYGPSDHASFVVNNIPVVMFFTGIEEDYHTPNDDADKINYNGMVMAAKYIYNFVESVGNCAVKPTFIKSENAAPERKKGKESGKSDVWFGIIPNFEENPLGCIIAGSTPGSPAEKAGLVAKDIIVKIDDTEIKNLYDFMYKIRAHKAGDVLKVHVLRGEDYTTKIELDVTLVQKIK